MSINRTDIDYISNLARLALTENEKELFTEQMGAILMYVEKLNKLDTEGICPTSHAVPMENAFRDDIPATSIGIERALANAPDRHETYFRVPQVIE